MTWVKLDEGFPNHPKALAAGLQARALFIASLCYSNRHLTDGIIVKPALRLIAAEAEVNGKKSAAILVSVGLWHDQGDYWEIHDYLDYQPSRDEVERDRSERHEAKVRAGRLGGLASGEARAKQNRSRDEAEPKQEAKQNASKTKPRPDPTRPDPKLKGSTDVMTLPQGVDEGDGGILNAALLEACLDLEIRNRTTGRDPVDDPSRWKKTMRTKRWGSWGADIIRLSSQFPDAPSDIIAAAIVTGEKQTLRYYTGNGTTP